MSDERENGTSDPEVEPYLPEIPPELGVEPLLAALLQCAAFLDLGDDTSVDPVQADEVLEHVGMYVQRLPPERVADIEKQLARLKEHAEKANWPEPIAAFVADFLYSCGIGEDEDDEGQDS
jgi:hypothetical protein